MNCDTCLNEIDDFALGTCGTQIQIAIEEHLNICHTCTKEFSQIKWYFRKISEVPLIISAPLALKEELSGHFHGDSAVLLPETDEGNEPKSELNLAEGSVVRTIHQKPAKSRISEEEFRQNRIFLIFLVGVLLLAYIILRFIFQP